VSAGCGGVSAVDTSRPDSRPHPGSAWPQRTPHAAPGVHCRGRPWRMRTVGRDRMSPRLLRAAAVSAADTGRPDSTATWPQFRKQEGTLPQVSGSADTLGLRRCPGSHFGTGRRWTASCPCPAAPCACPAGRDRRVRQRPESKGAWAGDRVTREASCPRRARRWPHGHTSKAAPLARRPTLGVRGPRTRIDALKLW
jgi:hypothetical protein